MNLTRSVFLINNVRKNFTRCSYLPFMGGLTRTSLTCWTTLLPYLTLTRWYLCFSLYDTNSACMNHVRGWSSQKSGMREETVICVTTATLVSVMLSKIKFNFQLKSSLKTITAARGHILLRIPYMVDKFITEFIVKSTHISHFTELFLGTTNIANFKNKAISLVSVDSYF